MTHAENSELKEIKAVTVGQIDYRFYMPAQGKFYHTFRRLEAEKHDTYANLGASEKQFRALATAGLDIVNKASVERIRTDVGALFQAMEFMMDNPCDNKSLVRLGAVLTFLEYTAPDGRLISEDPNSPEQFYEDKKMELCQHDKDLYAFFLNMGKLSSSKYSKISLPTDDTDYSTRKNETILQTLSPFDTLKTLWME